MQPTQVRYLHRSIGTLSTDLNSRLHAIPYACMRYADGRVDEEKEGETINAIVNDSEESHDVREAEPMEVSDAATAQQNHTRNGRPQRTRRLNTRIGSLQPSRHVRCQPQAKRARHG